MGTPVLGCTCSSLSVLSIDSFLMFGAGGASPNIGALIKGRKGGGVGEERRRGEKGVTKRGGGMPWKGWEKKKEGNRTEKR